MSDTLIEEKPIEIKTPKMDVGAVDNKTLTILKGRKTMLFPFHIVDVKDFVRLHRNDKHGYMGRFCFKYMTEGESITYLHALIATNQIHIWTVTTKEAKPRFVGFVYVSDVEKYKCTMGGSMDSLFAKGLSRELRRDKYTYSEDAFRALINHVFTSTMIRIEADVVEDNRMSLALCKKVGFSIEGVRRKSMEMDGKFFNVIYLSLLKEEYRNV